MLVALPDASLTVDLPVDASQLFARALANAQASDCVLEAAACQPEAGQTALASPVWAACVLGDWQEADERAVMTAASSVDAEVRDGMADAGCQWTNAVAVADHSARLY